MRKPENEARSSRLFRVCAAGVFHLRDLRCRCHPILQRSLSATEQRLIMVAQGMAPELPKTETRASIRGPLRYQVSISSPQIEAGRPFSVFVRITNPYDVPAEIIGLNTRLPVEFVDVESLRRAAEKQKLSDRLSRIIREQIRSTGTRKPAAAVVEDSKEKLQRFAKLVSSVLPLFGLGVVSGIASATGSLVAHSIKASSLSESEERNLFVEDLLSPEDIESIAKVAEEKESPKAVYEIAARRLQERLRTLDASRRESAILQPGNSIVQVFTLKTTRAILFSPSTYNLHIQSEYKIDSAANQDSVDYQLNVRAPLQALIFGSVLGSISGFLLRSIFDPTSIQTLTAGPAASVWIPWVVALIGNVLLGVIIVIAFARKKDAQPILAIEDFWGGVFVGVLAGYSGKSLLDQFLKAPNAANVAVPRP